MMGKSHILVNSCVLAQTICLSRLDIFQDIASKSLRFITNGNPSIPNMAIGAGLFLLGALLPDIDNPRSILGRRFYLPVTHHRLTHTLWALLILSAISVVNHLAIALALGYLCHLLTDAPGAQGIAWLYPITGYKTYKNGASVKNGHTVHLYHTGQLSETILVWTIVCCTVVICAVLIKIKPM